MSKVKIVGNAVVITSDLKREEIERVKKYTKDGLKLKDEKGNDVFTIALGENSSISQFGITYGEQNAEGYAQATLLLDESIEPDKRMDTVLDTHAITLTQLNTLETYIRSTATELESTIAGIADSIEVIG